MTDDLVKRLRDGGPCRSDIGCAVDICAEAADRIEALERALRECADDLEAELAYRYTSVLQYPSMKIKYESDMEPVASARALLGDAKENQS